MQCLEGVIFPIRELGSLASAQALKLSNFAGSRLKFAKATPEARGGVDIVLGAAGDGSRRAAPEAVKRGCVCVTAHVQNGPKRSAGNPRD